MSIQQIRTSPETCVDVVVLLSQKHPDLLIELLGELAKASESGASDSEASESGESGASDSEASELEHRTRQVICTPITHKAKKVRQRQLKPCPRTDYLEQKIRNEPILNGELFWCWDDGPQNKARVGDVFIFWDYNGVGKGGPGNPWGGGDFIFHEVEAVCDPSNRLPSWSNNIGQQNRNVLQLSPPKMSLTYKQMIDYGAKPQYHGTKYLKTGFHRDSELMRLINQSFN
jgi:hypothetical protein